MRIIDLIIGVSHFREVHNLSRLCGREPQRNRGIQR